MLQEREEQLRLVLEGAELGFWDWNIVTGEVRRNERWAKMLGYPYEEIQNTTQQWTHFIHPDDRDKAWQSISDALEGQFAHKVEYRMICKDGSIKWILDQANVAQRDADGRPTRMCGTHMDITERKQAEINLHIAATIFESQEGMFVTNADSIIFLATSRIATASAETARLILLTTKWIITPVSTGITKMLRATKRITPDTTWIAALLHIA